MINDNFILNVRWNLDLRKILGVAKIFLESRFFPKSVFLKSRFHSTEGGDCPPAPFKVPPAMDAGCLRLRLQRDEDVC